MGDDLITCDVCGKEISRWAETYPNCGGPRNQEGLTGCSSEILRLFWSTILIVLIVKLLISIW